MNQVKHHNSFIYNSSRATLIFKKKEKKWKKNQVTS